MEMSYNARIKLRENLKAKVDEFHASHDQSSHGNRASVKKDKEGFISKLLAKGKENQAKQTVMFEKIVEAEKNKPPAPKPEPSSKKLTPRQIEEFEHAKKFGTPLTMRTFIEATARGRPERAPDDHIMTQREFIIVTGRANPERGANDHGMTQREFIEITSRGNPERGATDHPMTIREYREATGRGGIEDAPNDHPMTVQEYRRAWAMGKSRKWGEK